MNALIHFVEGGYVEQVTWSALAKWHGSHHRRKGHEWWEVSDGVKVFECFSQESFEWLLAQLNHLEGASK